MKFKRILNLIFHNCGYYIWLMYVSALVVAVYDYKAAIPLAAISTFCLLVVISSGAVRRKGIKNFIEALTAGMDQEEKDAIGFGITPIAIINQSGIISWTNSHFSDVSDIILSDEMHINELIPEFSIEACLEANKNHSDYKITHNDKNYIIKLTYSDKNNEKNLDTYYALYFYDCTEFDALKKLHEDKTFVSASIIVDNYDEVMQDVGPSDRPRVSAAIEEALSVYAQSVNGIIKKYEKNRFFLYFAKEGLNTFLEKKFDILEKIKEISVGNKMAPTISIGIGYGGENMAQDDSYSYTALDMALGRGGDQVIVKNNEKYSFFGGNTRETERRARVKARVVADAIKQIVNENDDILIMGHKNADSDAFGAAIGMFRIIRFLGKSCKIVMETQAQTVSRTLDKFTDDEYADVVINKAYANEIVNKNTLIFVVDAHVKSILEEPALLDVSKKVVVIDHHRRSADFIQNPLISYHEPYASSTAELVTEIIQYLGEGIKPTKCEAEALFAGMYLDTKNFTFKTGVRTFDTASYLKRLGADTISVKKLFQIDQTTFTKKLAIMENAMTYRHSISIATCTKNDPDMNTIVAQAADELLSITDITCSFVLCDMGGKVIISARSLGDINVQVIMEKLGGGGHMTVAAAQLSDVNTEFAVKELKSVIDEYLDEKKGD